MFCFCKITLILLLFAGIECAEDNDEGDITGYGIYKVFLSSKKDIDLLTDLAVNKIIYPMKKSAFNWKVLVRANHEHYFQRRLIENKINYIVVQTSLEDTLNLNRANVGSFSEEVLNEKHGKKGKGQLSLYSTNNPKYFPTEPNSQRFPPLSQNREPPKCFPTSPLCFPPSPQNRESPKYIPTEPNSQPFSPMPQYKEPPKCFPTSPLCFPPSPQNREPPKCSPNDPNCHLFPPLSQIREPPKCFPTSPLCFPPLNSYLPYSPYLPLYEGPYNHQNNPIPFGTYFYCYLTGVCVPLSPPPLNYLPMQQNLNYQNRPRD